MMNKKLILDFDGTLTDIKAEAEPMLAKWHDLFAEQLGVPLDDLLRAVEKGRHDVLADPASGWAINGKVVAPASVDPYVCNTAIYQSLLQGIRKREILPGAVIPWAPHEDSSSLQPLFRQAYPYAATVFKESAKAFLDEVKQSYDVFIVTNSGTEDVKRKLSALGEDDLSVIGNAKKYVIDETLEDVPRSIRPDGFPRPVLLRRKQYHAILEQCGCSPSDTLVFGDIYELDLSLPQALGYPVVLAANESTPPYERDYLATVKNAAIADSLEEALELFKK